MDEERRKLSEAWKKERNEQEARRDAFYAKLQADCPRLWRTPPERGWYPCPTTPEAWDDLIYDLSVKVERLFDSIEEITPASEMPFVKQCKEKFGGLRFYISHYPETLRDDLDKIIGDAEQLSFTVCIKCGTTESTKNRNRFPSPNEEHHFGWVSPYCDPCFEKEALERARTSGVKAVRKWYHETMVARKAARKAKKE